VKAFAAGPIQSDFLVVVSVDLSTRLPCGLRLKISAFTALGGASEAGIALFLVGFVA